MKYTRDEVETFLNAHSDEALDSMPQNPRPLAKWLADFGKAMAKKASEEAGLDDEDEDSEESVFDDDDNGGLFGDPEDL